MYQTDIDRAIEDEVLSAIDDPDNLRMIADFLDKLRDGFFDKTFQDVIFQKWEGKDRITACDAYAFASVWSLMCYAKIVMARVVIEATPCADKEKEEMNRRLSTGLGKGFRAEFFGGTLGSDGNFLVDGEIQLDATNKESNEHIVKTTSGKFPLEVGYISAAKTMYYFAAPPYRLARWPYNQKVIWLMERIDK